MSFMLIALAPIGPALRNWHNQPVRPLMRRYYSVMHCAYRPSGGTALAIP